MSARRLIIIRMNLSLSRVTRLIAAASLCIAATLPALGQQAEEADISAPVYSGWVSLVIGFIFLAAIAIGSFKTPKRTHQDG